MKNYSPLPYLPNLFATCMVFMVIYTLCVLLWIWMPEMPGHVILTTLIPSFKLLDFANFCYGMMMSAILWLVCCRNLCVLSPPMVKNSESGHCKMKYLFLGIREKAIAEAEFGGENRRWSEVTPIFFPELSKLFM